MCSGSTLAKADKKELFKVDLKQLPNVHKLPLVFRKLLLLLAYQLLACFLFKSVLVDHTFTLLTWQDASEQSYAWLTKVWQAARAGELALWDFGIYSGTSFVGELQTAPFYPISLAFSVIARTTSPRFVDAFLVMHFGLAAFFTHELLRGIRASYTAAILGAVIFAFASPFALRSMGQPNIFCGLVFMPATALFILNAIRATSLVQTISWTMLTGIGLSFSILAGHVHSYIHIAVVLVLICAAYYLQFPGTSVVRLATVCFSAFGISLLGASVQLFATREYLELAYKWYSDGHFTRSPHVVPFAEMSRNAIPPPAFQTAFPWSPRTVAGVSLFSTYCSIPLVAVSLLALKSFAGKWAWLMLVTSLFLATAGSSWSGPFLHQIPVLNLVREPDRALHIYALGIAVAASLGFDALLNCERYRGWIRGIAFVLLVGVCVETYVFDRQMVIPITSEKCPYVQYSNPVLSFLKSRTADDGMQFRFHQLSTDQLPPNAGDVAPVLNLLGYRASMLGSYFDFLSQSWDIFSQNMNLLSVRYVVTEKNVDNLPTIFVNGDTKVYERPGALPIFWNLDKGGHKYALRISSITWKTNSVVVQFNSIRDGFLIFSQPDYPGWVAYVNGQKRMPCKWGIFTAVPISHSDSHVKFAYEPPWLIPFGLISLITLMLCSLVPLAVFSCSPLKLSENQVADTIRDLKSSGAK